MAPARIARAVAFSLVAFAAAVLAISPAPDAADPAVALSLATLGIELGLAFVALAWASLSPRPLAARLGLGPSRLGWRPLLLLVLGTLATSHGVDSLLQHFGWREDSVLAEFEAQMAGARGASLLLALLAVALAPGVAEELLCRGLVQRGLEGPLGRGGALVLAALFFGALHLDPVHSVAAALLGLYLGAAALLADSVRASMLCHATNNAVAVLLAAWLPPPGLGGPLTAAASFALAGLCLWTAWRHAPPRPTGS